MLDQAVNDMKVDLLKMKEASNEVLAAQKAMEDKYRAATAGSEAWLKRAELAISKGEDELAREALKRRKNFQVHGDTKNGLGTSVIWLWVRFKLCAG